MLRGKVLADILGQSAKSAKKNYITENLLPLKLFYNSSTLHLYLYSSKENVDKLIKPNQFKTIQFGSIAHSINKKNGEKTLSNKSTFNKFVYSLQLYNNKIFSLHGKLVSGKEIIRFVGSPPSVEQKRSGVKLKTLPDSVANIKVHFSAFESDFRRVEVEEC